MVLCRGHAQHPPAERGAARATGEPPTIRLRAPQIAALWIGLLMVGCQIEDRTPTGSRRDEDTIQHLLSRYAHRLSTRDWSGVRSLFWQDGSYAGPIGPGAPASYHQAVPIDAALRSMERWLRGVEPRNFDVRVVRTDLRQDGDLAAAWLTTRRVTPSGPTAIEGDWVEHIVLRRIDDDWRILSVAVASPGRRTAH